MFQPTGESDNLIAPVPNVDGEGASWWYHAESLSRSRLTAPAAGITTVTRIPRSELKAGAPCIKWGNCCILTRGLYMEYLPADCTRG